MTTGFNTQQGQGNYYLQFETTNKEYFLFMQEMARRCVDGKIPKRKVVHAHWIHEEVKCQNLGKPTIRYYRRCSACGKRYPRDPRLKMGINLCPACGAHMDEEVADG